MATATIRAAAIFATACVVVWARPSLAQCLGDFNGDGKVSVDELVTAVDNSLNGCQSGGPRFVDNGTGTVTDRQTGLMWEKKENLDGIINYADPHDADNTYTWSAAPAPDGTAYRDGTAYAVFLSTLNNGASTDGGASTPITGCFANHCDWRLPTIVELQGILDATQGSCGGGSGVCIDPAFGPTQPVGYWSSTTSGGVGGIWGMNFNGFGPGNGDDFTDLSYVRAVRTGS